MRRPGARCGTATTRCPASVVARTRTTSARAAWSASVVIPVRTHSVRSRRAVTVPASAALATQRQQPADPLAVTLQELARDQRALDLVGALADDHEGRVAVVALDVECRREPGLAVHAQGVEGE